MNEAPERIYSGPSVDDKGVFWDVGHWDEEPDEGCIEYVRADRIEELEAELHLLKTSGIAEVAVRNQNVMEYMRHWEGRAEAADAELEKQLKIAAANEESEGAASFRVSRFMYELTGGQKDD